MKSQAIEKIKQESAKPLKERYAEAMRKETAKALQSFCQQNEEFAQAVVQGGSFEDCMNAVAGKVKGNSISDFAAFSAAAEFYFPGAVVEFKMTIHMSRFEAEEQGMESDAISLKLEDYL